MAFNPFHGFRKHQKSIFAVLVIICMFVFILQSGMAGDFISGMLNWFGSSRGKGTLVATINGNKVYESDLTRLTRARAAASELIFLAAIQAQQPTDPKARPSLGFLMMQILTDPQYRFFRDRLPQFPFGDYTTTAADLDFLAWKGQADRLGISLTEADVRGIINRFVGGTRDIFDGKSFTSSRLVGDIVNPNRSRTNNRRPVTADELLKAITDEYRVYIAQEVILGTPPGLLGGLSQVNGVTAHDGLAVTPGEFFKYYRDERATLSVFLKPIPVESLVGQVKTTPTDEQLRQLYDDYKDAEPNPLRAAPAFKVPQKTKLEWVTAKADLPYFKDLAKKTVALPEAYTKFGSRVAANVSVAAQVGLSATVFTAPGATAPWLALAAAPATYDRTFAKYVDYEERQRAPLMKDFSGQALIHDHHLLNPNPAQLIAATLANGANPAAGAAGVVTAWADAAAASEIAEWRRLMDRELAAIGSPSLLSPIVGAYVPKVPSYWEVRERFVTELEKQEAAILVDTEMAKFAAEVAKTKGKVDEARKLIAETVKKFGLTQDDMKEALDRYDLVSDTKGPKALREAYKEKDRDVNPNPPTFEQFAMGETTQMGQPPLYDPMQFRSNKETYLVWRTEYLPAREPRFAEVRPEVEKAWLVEEARNLARKQAQDWIAEVKGMRPRAKTEALDAKGKPVGFTINGVCRLESQTAQPAAGGRSYTMYTIPKSAIAEPRPDTVETLVKQLKEDGDTVVFSDQPERNFYVAVLLSRDNMTDIAGFKDVLKATPNDDQLFGRFFMPKEQEEYRKLVMKQLRTDAGAKLREDGSYDLPPDIRIRGTDND